MGLIAQRVINNPIVQAVHRAQNQFINHEATKFASAIVLAPVITEYTITSGLINTEFWVTKATISTTSQAIVNEGEVNLVGVASDALLVPGLSNVVGASTEVKVDLFNPTEGIKTRSIFSQDKSLSEFGVQVSTSLFFSAKIKVINTTTLTNNANRRFLVPIISAPSSLTSGALQKEFTERINE